MIKVFGKLRYHWQPELSFFVIYWSLAFIPIFISMALLLENTKISKSSLSFFFVFIVLFGIGIHRYFVISDEKDEFLVYSSIPGLPRKHPISGISRIDISKHTLKIFSKNWPNGKIFYMKKWTKKYFLDALVSNKYFMGEVELIGNVNDYFDIYKDEKDRKKGPKAL